MPHPSEQAPHAGSPLLRVRAIAISRDPAGQIAGGVTQLGYALASLVEQIPAAPRGMAAKRAAERGPGVIDQQGRQVNAPGQLRCPVQQIAERPIQ